MASISREITIDEIPWCHWAVVANFDGVRISWWQQTDDWFAKQVFCGQRVGHFDIPFPLLERTLNGTNAFPSVLAKLAFLLSVIYPMD
jgi:hypothetical protein